MAFVGHRARLQQPFGDVVEAAAARQPIGADAALVARPGIGPRVEQDADDGGRTATADRMQQRTAARTGLVGVAAVGQQQAQGLRPFVIERTEQRVAAGDAGAGLEQQAHDGGVGGLGGVVQRLVVVRVGARGQQPLRDRDIVVAPGGAVQRAQRVVGELRIDPADVGIGAGREQQVDAGAYARRVGGQRDHAGKAGADQRRHAAAGMRRVHPGGVGGDRRPHGDDVADGAGERGFAVQQARMVAQQAFGQPRPGHLVAVAEGPLPPLLLPRRRVGGSRLQFDVVLQLRPGIEAVFARHAGLRIVQAQLHRRDGRVIAVGRGGQGEAKAFERCGIAAAHAVEQGLGLLLQMVQVRTLGQSFHDNLHAMDADGPQARLHKGWWWQAIDKWVEPFPRTRWRLATPGRKHIARAARGGIA